jgi:hypothetical protein
MFVQVVGAPVSDRASVLEGTRRGAEALRSDSGGFLGLTAAVTDDGRFIGVARFERPARTAWWSGLEPWLEGTADVRSSSDVELLLGGGADGAGFVEVIEGRTNDRGRFMELERQLEQSFAAERPDFLGSLLIWWPDGAWLEVASFTSEADVRAADARPLSPTVEALISAWEEVARPSSQLDLADPLLVPAGEAMVWVVAGCLFEVSLPPTPAGGWRWTNGGPHVTLVGDDVRDGRQHLRFRAEAAGADLGVVELRFEGEGGDPADCTVSVRIAPETAAGPRARLQGDDHRLRNEIAGVAQEGR